jgi:putative membrane protein
MNTITESKHATEHTKAWFFKLPAGSTAVRLALALAAGFLVGLPCARAQTNLATMDSDFILTAAQGGMTEVALGELATEKGVRDDVKGLGKMMVKAHKSMNDDLKSLATQKGVILPTTLDAKHQAIVDKMTALTGTEFDDAYIAGMVKGHTKDAKAFKSESATTQDADIKGFLDKSIPVVEMHLKHVTAMQK